MGTTFDPGLIERLRAAEEVEIETRAAPEASAHRTVIWVVVDDRDRVLVRTYLGPRSRWYREVTSHAACLVHVDGKAVPVLAVPALDDERVVACSRGYLAKYARRRATPQMLDETNLPTTLELLPR